MVKNDDFEDWAAICEVKARYCRFLDTKQWDAWTALFTEDFVLDTSDGGGPPPIEGREMAIAMVRGYVETARTAHQVHNPEITIEGDTAHGIWALQDRVIFDTGHGHVGYGHYTETYVKAGGGWRIARSKLKYLHMDQMSP